MKVYSGQALPPKLQGDLFGSLTIRLNSCKLGSCSSSNNLSIQQGGDSLSKTFCRFHFWGQDGCVDVNIENIESCNANGGGNASTSTDGSDSSIMIEYPLVGTLQGLQDYFADMSILPILIMSKSHSSGKYESLIGQGAVSLLKMFSELLVWEAPRSSGETIARTNNGTRTQTTTKQLSVPLLSTPNDLGGGDPSFNQEIGTLGLVFTLRFHTGSQDCVTYRKLLEDNTNTVLVPDNAFDEVAHKTASIIEIDPISHVIPTPESNNSKSNIEDNENRIMSPKRATNTLGPVMDTISSEQDDFLRGNERDKAMEPNINIGTSAIPPDNLDDEMSFSVTTEDDSILLDAILGGYKSVSTKNGTRGRSMTSFQRCSNVERKVVSALLQNSNSMTSTQFTKFPSIAKMGINCCTRLAAVRFGEFTIHQVYLSSTNSESVMSILGDKNRHEIEYFLKFDVPPAVVVPVNTSKTTVLQVCKDTIGPSVNCSIKKTRPPGRRLKKKKVRLRSEGSHQIMDKSLWNIQFENDVDVRSWMKSWTIYLAANVSIISSTGRTKRRSGKQKKELPPSSRTSKKEVIIAKAAFDLSETFTKSEFSLKTSAPFISMEKGVECGSIVIALKLLPSQKGQKGVLTTIKAVEEEVENIVPVMDHFQEFDLKGDTIVSAASQEFNEVRSIMQTKKASEEFTLSGMKLETLQDVPVSTVDCYKLTVEEPRADIASVSPLWMCIFVSDVQCIVKKPHASLFLKIICTMMQGESFVSPRSFLNDRLDGKYVGDCSWLAPLLYTSEINSLGNITIEIWCDQTDCKHGKKSEAMESPTTELLGISTVPFKLHPKKHIENTKYLTLHDNSIYTEDHLSKRSLHLTVSMGTLNQVQQSAKERKSANFIKNWWLRSRERWTIRKRDNVQKKMIGNQNRNGNLEDESCHESVEADENKCGSLEDMSSSSMDFQSKYALRIQSFWRHKKTFIEKDSHGQRSIPTKPLRQDGFESDLSKDSANEKILLTDKKTHISPSWKSDECTIFINFGECCGVREILSLWADSSPSGEDAASILNRTHHSSSGIFITFALPGDFSNQSLCKKRRVSYFSSAITRLDSIKRHSATLNYEFEVTSYQMPCLKDSDFCENIEGCTLECWLWYVPTLKNTIRTKFPAQSWDKVVVPPLSKRLCSATCPLDALARSSETKVYRCPWRNDSESIGQVHITIGRKRDVSNQIPPIQIASGEQTTPEDIFDWDLPDRIESSMSKARKREVVIRQANCCVASPSQQNMKSGRISSPSYTLESSNEEGGTIGENLNQNKVDSSSSSVVDHPPSSRPQSSASNSQSSHIENDNDRYKSECKDDRSLSTQIAGQIGKTLNCRQMPNQLIQPEHKSTPSSKFDRKDKSHKSFKTSKIIQKDKRCRPPGINLECSHAESKQYSPCSRRETKYYAPGVASLVEQSTSKQNPLHTYPDSDSESSCSSFSPMRLKTDLVNYSMMLSPESNSSCDISNNRDNAEIVRSRETCDSSIQSDSSSFEMRSKGPRQKFTPQALFQPNDGCSLYSSDSSDSSRF